MKTIFFSLLGPGGAALLFLHSTGSGALAQEVTKWTAPQWEYRVLRIDDRRAGNTTGTRARASASESKLNELGKEGWELVSVRNDGSSEPVFYFKRQKQR